MTTKSRMFAIVSITTGSLLAAGTAAAVNVGLSGTSMVQRLVQTQDRATEITGVEFRDIPTAALTLTVPPSATRLVTARFTAESTCTGTGVNGCKVQIVARSNPVGARAEMHPRSGDDANFDWATPELRRESHSVARSIVLTQGSWTIIVQETTSAESGVTARVDDWILEVDVNAR